MSNIPRRTIASVFGVATTATAKSLTDLGFSADDIANAEEMAFETATQPANYRYDGSTAVVGAGGGHLAAVGIPIEILGADDIANFSIIAVSTAGVVSVSLKK